MLLHNLSSGSFKNTSPTASPSACRRHHSIISRKENTRALPIQSAFFKINNFSVCLFCLSEMRDMLARVSFFLRCKSELFAFFNICVPLQNTFAGLYTEATASLCLRPLWRALILLLQLSATSQPQRKHWLLFYVKHVTVVHG